MERGFLLPKEPKQMSWLSRALGLDAHKEVLALLNSVGHSLAAQAATAALSPGINARIGAVVDKTVGPILDKLPLPADEAGVAKWYLGNALKTAIDAEMAAWEPAPAPAQPFGIHATDHTTAPGNTAAPDYPAAPDYTAAPPVLPMEAPAPFGQPGNPA